MSRKPRARPRSPKPKGSAKIGANARKPGKAARGRLHPPAEEDLGGGDICSLEEKPSTEDNMPLVAPDSAAAMAAKNPAAPPPMMMICLEFTREELQNFRRA